MPDCDHEWRKGRCVRCQAVSDEAREQEAIDARVAEMRRERAAWDRASVLSDPAFCAAYAAGRAESERTDSDPARCVCPYAEGTAEERAFNLGWGSHYDEKWDKEPCAAPARESGR